MNLFIIVPCYNEYSRLPLILFENFILRNPELKICFVNDGSSDDTGTMLNNFACKYQFSVTVVHLPENQGKGEAIRQGINYVLTSHEPTYLSYLDADLSAPLEEVMRIYNIIQQQEELLCVFGSRISVFGSEINRLSYRHYGGRVIATMIDAVLRLSIYDTQCGLKIFHYTLAKEIFKEAFLSRWLFDVEVFAKMKLLFSPQDLNRIMREIPINKWSEKGNSKVKFIDIFKIPFELFGINNKYKIHNSQSVNYGKLLPKLPSIF